MTGPLTTSTPALYLGAAEAGLWPRLLPRWEVFDALASGRLVSVLDDWSPSFAGSTSSIRAGTSWGGAASPDRHAEGYHGIR